MELEFPIYLKLKHSYTYFCFDSEYKYIMLAITKKRNEWSQTLTFGIHHSVAFKEITEGGIHKNYWLEQMVKNHIPLTKEQFDEQIEKYESGINEWKETFWALEPIEHTITPPDPMPATPPIPYDMSLIERDESPSLEDNQPTLFDEEPF